MKQPLLLDQIEQKPKKKGMTLSKTLKQLQNSDNQTCFCNAKLQQSNQQRTKSKKPKKKVQKISKPASFAIKTRKQFEKHFNQHFKCSKYCYDAIRTRPVALYNQHSTCKYPACKVPNYVGWDWMAGTAEQRKGWRPGAIPKRIQELMRHFLDPFPGDTTQNTKRKQCQQNEAELKQIPMLRVQRKNGNYIITMNPLKSAEELKTSADPYMHCKPVKFKISSSTNEKLYASLRKLVREKGFQPCSCGQTVAKCRCRDNKEMEQLQAFLHSLKIPNIDDNLVLNNNESDNKLDFEFTPPAGMIKPHLFKPPKISYQETQYDEKDFKGVWLDAGELKKNNKKGGDKVTGTKKGRVSGVGGGAGGDSKDSRVGSVGKGSKGSKVGGRFKYFSIEIHNNQYIYARR